MTPADLQYLIDDLFEHDHALRQPRAGATAKALADGRYEVTSRSLAKKRKADELGKENDAPLHDFIDIGVLGADDEPLFLEKRKIDARGNRRSRSSSRRGPRAPASTPTTS